MDLREPEGGADCVGFHPPPKDQDMDGSQAQRSQLCQVQPQRNTDLFLWGRWKGVFICTV